MMHTLYFPLKQGVSRCFARKLLVLAYKKMEKGTVIGEKSNFPLGT